MKEYYMIATNNKGYYRPGLGEVFTNKRAALKECRLRNKYEELPNIHYVVVNTAPKWDSAPIDPQTIITK